MPCRPLPSLPSLRAFECVARHGSFKEASKELFVTPGALSQLVKKLEEELNKELFVRGHRTIQLTQDGRALISGLQRGFTLLKESVDALRCEERCRLNIAASPSIVSNFILPNMHVFMDSYPNLDMHFVSDYEMLNFWENDVDVGIRLAVEASPCMRSTILASEKYVVVASPQLIKKYQLNQIRNLASAPLLTVSSPQEDMSIACWPQVFAQLGMAETGRARKVDFDSRLDHAIDAAIADAGALIVPFRFVASHIVAGSLSILLSDVIPMKALEYQAVCVAEKANNQNVQWFLEWMKQEFRTCTAIPSPLFSQALG